jgi:hypothetical protein
MVSKAWKNLGEDEREEWEERSLAKTRRGTRWRKPCIAGHGKFLPVARDQRKMVSQQLL